MEECLAQGLPVVGHLDPAFSEVMEEVSDSLRQVFQTTNEICFAASATGMIHFVLFTVDRTLYFLQR